MTVRIRRLRPWAVAFAALLITAPLVSCSSNEGAASSGKPRKGGTATIALGNSIVCLDPHQSVTTDVLTVARNVVESLTEYDPKAGKLLPSLAESWSVNSNQTQFTFKLKNGVKFSDGTDFDANSVKNTFDYIVHTLGAKAVRANGYLADYAKTGVVDKYTAVVSFKRPSAAFLRATATTYLGIVGGVSTKATPEQRCQGKLVGTGPFKIAEYVPNNRVGLKSRIDYVNVDPLGLHSGAAYLDGVTFDLVPETNVRVGSVVSGQVEGATQLQPQDLSRLKSGNATVLSQSTPGIPLSLLPNLGSDAVKNPKVRAAIQMGIDRPALVKLAGGKPFAVAQTALSAGTDGFASQATHMHRDVEAAKNMLSGAGWKVGADGYRQKDGKSLTLSLIYYTDIAPPYISTVVQALQGQFKQLGIKLDLDGEPFASVLTKIFAFKYDLYLLTVTDVGINVLQDSLVSLLMANTDVPANLGLAKNLLQVNALPDGAERNRQMAAIQETFVKEGLIFPIMDNYQIAAASSKLHGIRLTDLGYLDLYDAWL